MDHTSPNSSLNSSRNANGTEEIEHQVTYRKTKVNKDSSYTEEEFSATKSKKVFSNTQNYLNDKSFATSFTKDQQSQSLTNPISLITLAGIVVLLVLLYYAFFVRSSSQLPTKFQCLDFKEQLPKQFTHQDELLWKSLKIGIENVLNKKPSKPSVFLLAYNDIETSRNVMEKILNATANCMKSQDPIKLDGESFATEAMIKDYGEIIAKYQTQLEHNGIMYVSDINKTPIEAAQVFHAICDTITPLVERAVIFFTIYLDPYDRHMSSNEILNLVEKKLESNWYNDGNDNSINDNTLKALIVRVTDQVFLLHSENK